MNVRECLLIGAPIIHSQVLQGPKLSIAMVPRNLKSSHLSYLGCSSKRVLKVPWMPTFAYNQHVNLHVSGVSVYPQLA